MVKRSDLDNLRKDILSRLAYAQRHLDEVPFGKIVELHAALLSALPALEDDVTAQSDYYKGLFIGALKEIILFESTLYADIYNDISGKTLFELGFRSHADNVAVVDDGKWYSYQRLLDALDEDASDGLQQIPWQHAASMTVYKYIRELTKANI